jgi:tRNA dimethylallyltransferase
MNKYKKNKVIVISGPTSSGKTKLAVELAFKFGGEIVSADSRQVYKGMDIGTGKDLAEYSIVSKVKGQKLKVIKIPYHLIDVAKPTEQFDLAKYQKLAFNAIGDILERGKLPIVAGGSGLYLQAIVDNYVLSSTGPDEKLRRKLEKLSVEVLYKKLSEINKKFALKLNNSERNNERRLIRYIEILSKKTKKQENKKANFNYNFVILGLNWPREVLNERIHKRLIDRLEKENMIGEVKRLHKEGVSWKKLESFGLEYKFISLYLQKKLNYEEMVEKLNIASSQFAKRQMSWFRRWERRGRKIVWVKKYNQAEKIVKEFIK